MMIMLTLSMMIGMGCQESPSPVSDPETGQRVVLLDLSAHLLAPGAFDGTGLSKEERTFIARASNDSQIRFVTLIQESATWEEAHEKVQGVLDSPSEIPDYVREQNAAVYMLKAAKSLERVGEEHLDAIGFYTDLLARHRSPEAGLMVRSLELLDGHWPEEKIRVAASRGLEGAEHYLDRHYYCEDCEAPKMLASQHEAIRQTQDVFLAEVLGAVEQLSALSAE